MHQVGQRAVMVCSVLTPVWWSWRYWTSRLQNRCWVKLRFLTVTVRLHWQQLLPCCPPPRAALRNTEDEAVQAHVPDFRYQDQHRHSEDLRLRSHHPISNRALPALIQTFNNLSKRLLRSCFQFPSSCSEAWEGCQRSAFRSGPQWFSHHLAWVGRCIFSLHFVKTSFKCWLYGARHMHWWLWRVFLQSCQMYSSRPSFQQSTKKNNKKINKTY